MELEMRLKINKIVDDFESVDLLVSKDSAGPLFFSSETVTMFILTAHLKGYKRKNIKIEINKDGTRITISGEKSVHETTMVGMEVYKKEVEIRGFRKAFKIPNGVVWDRVKAKFNVKESSLTISMPKFAKGMFGYKLEEVKEEEVPRGGSESMQVVVDETKEIQGGDRGVESFPGEAGTESGREFDKLVSKKVEENLKKENQELPSQVLSQDEKYDEYTNFPLVVREIRGEGREIEEIGHGIKEELETKRDQELDQIESSYQEVYGRKEINGTENGNREEEEMRAQEGGNVESGGKESENESHKKSKLCVPLIAGSAFLVSLIVIVIHLIRTKNQQTNVKAIRKK